MSSSDPSCQTATVAMPLDKANSERDKHCPDWQLVKLNGIDQLERSYGFKNFVMAMDAAQQITELAEKFNHHPELVINWGQLTVRWWTHTVNGLHEMDFMMAEKTDQCLN